MVITVYIQYFSPLVNVYYILTPSPPPLYDHIHKILGPTEGVPWDEVHLPTGSAETQEPLPGRSIDISIQSPEQDVYSILAISVSSQSGKSFTLVSLSPKVSGFTRASLGSTV